MQSIMMYRIAMVIGNAFGGKTLSYDTVFPGFKEQQQVQQSWQDQKQRVMTFVEKYNARKKLERLKQGKQGD